MKQNIKSLLIIFFIISCGSDDNDNCTKVINIPQTYFVNNQSYSYDVQQEVSCDFPEPEEPQIIEPPFLENFSYQVISFEFTPDTGNNTSRLQSEIKLINPNNYQVNGIPYFTINVDGIQVLTTYANLIGNQCNLLNANSNCTLFIDNEDSLDLGTPNTIELVDVEYILVN